MNKFCSNLVRAIRNFKNVEASSFKCVFSCSSKRHFSHTNHIEKSKLHDIEIPKVLLHEYLWEGLDKWSNRIALECAETGRKYTYNDIYKKSRALAVFLRMKLKLEAGSCAAFILRNVPEYCIGKLGVFQAGLIATTMNPIYTEEEIRRQLVDSNTKLIFTLSDLYPVVQKAISQIPNKKIPIVVIKEQENESNPSGAIKFEEICAGNFEILPWDAPKYEDVVILPYSSGTTGMPKGVQLTHRSIVSNLCQMLDPNVSLISETNSNHQDIIPCILPMFHIYGICVISLCALAMGAKIVMVPKFGSQMLINLLENNKPDVLYAVPPIILMLLNNPNIKDKHVQQLRTVVSSAAPLGSADIERFMNKSKERVGFYQIYGMTEASPLILAQTQKRKGGVKIGGSGLLLANISAKIVDVDDPNNIGLGPLQSGELIIKGPQIMKGYHNNLEATKAAIVDDGWLRTGDIAHFDEDGQFFITDRLKELIKVKGFQVAPAELEEILRDHPYVADAAVIGVPHPDFGEVPKAFIVPKSNTNLSTNNVYEFVASKVAKYKRLLGGIVVLEKIPKTPSGKILRRQLKNM